jgi:hypothetical protein
MKNIGENKVENYVRAITAGQNKSEEIMTKTLDKQFKGIMTTVRQQGQNRSESKTRLMATQAWTTKGGGGGKTGANRHGGTTELQHPTATSRLLSVTVTGYPARKPRICLPSRPHVLHMSSRQTVPSAADWGEACYRPDILRAYGASVV